MVLRFVINSLPYHSQKVGIGLLKQRAKLYSVAAMPAGFQKTICNQADTCAFRAERLVYCTYKSYTAGHFSYTVVPAGPVHFAIGKRSVTDIRT